MSAQTDHLASLSASESAPESNAAPAIPHPPVRWRTRVLVPASILGGVALLLIYSGWRSLRGSVEVRVTPVVVKAAQVPSQDQPTAAGGEAVVQAPGWIEPDPFPAYVAALAEGVVTRVSVLEGQRVEAGDVLAELNDESARISLAEVEAEILIARAEVEAAKADLEAAQADWDNPTARTRAVAVAEAEVAASRGELTLQDAEIALEQARLAEVRDEFDRMSRSQELQAAAPGEFARVSLRLAAQERAIDAARAKRTVIEAHLSHHEAELRAALESQRLRIDERRTLAAAKAALARAEAHVAQDGAKREEAALRLSRMSVRSPIAGVVMTRLVEPGSRVMLISDDQHASHVARLYDPARLQVRVDIPLAEAAKVGVGHRAEITTEALPDQMFRGIVTRRVDEANIQKNTVQVKVAIDDPSPILRPEMLARVRFFAGGAGPNSGADAGTPGARSPGHRLFVLRAALLHASGGQAHAWVVNQAGQTVKMTTVRYGGGTPEGWVEVLDGLRPGDRLVVGDTGRLREGTRVRVAGEAVVNPAGGSG